MRGVSVLSTEEKADLVRRLEAGERASALANEAGVLRKSLYQWRAAYLAFGAAGLNRKRGPKRDGCAAAARSSSPDALAAAARPPDTGPPDELGKAQARIAELERLVGRQQADRDFFEKPCGHGTEAPRERRAHLFAVIEAMTGEGSQGDLARSGPASRISSRSRVFRGRATIVGWSRSSASETTPICAI